MASKSEIADIWSEVRERWPHGDMPSMEHYDSLVPFGAHQIRAAVDALDREGQKFAARPTEITRRLAKAAINAPDWGAAVAEMRTQQVASGRRAKTADRVCPAGQCDGSGTTELDAEGNVIFSEQTGERPASTRECVCREQLLRETAIEGSADPIVAMFLTQCDQRKIAAVLDGDSTDYAQMRREYEAYVERLHRVVTHAGIDTAGLPELEALARERQGSGALGQPGFVKRLNEGEAA